MTTSNSAGTGSHRRLRVWQTAMNLVTSIYEMSRVFPADERFGLTAQMRRAAVSIPSNIAEGNDRSSRPDQVRFLIMARGSAAELETQLEIAVRLGFVSAEIAGPNFKLIDVVSRQLTRLRQSLEPR